MNEPDMRPASHAAIPFGLHVVAVTHILESIALGTGIVATWNDVDLLGSLDEAFVPLCVALSLLAVAGGLWTRKRWARLLALLIHWPICVAGTLLFFFSLYFQLFVHETGIAVMSGLTALGLIVLPPAIIVSSGLLWYLHRRMSR